MERVVEKLIEQGKTVATMESCTGGGVANAITNVPGASEVLRFSAVTYSNQFKVIMGINPRTIDKYSVYSPEVAREMAKAISEFTAADYGIGITGKLSRADINNPYGLDNQVFYSIYDRENNTYYTYNLFVDRDTRCDNKDKVIEDIEDKMIKLLSPKVKK